MGMGWFDKENAEIIVGRDGMWPNVWRWSVEVPVIYETPNSRSSRMHRMYGEALTRKRAWTRANEALATVQAWR